MLEEIVRALCPKESKSVRQKRIERENAVFAPLEHAEEFKEVKQSLEGLFLYERWNGIELAQAFFEYGLQLGIDAAYRGKSIDYAVREGKLYIGEKLVAGEDYEKNRIAIMYDSRTINPKVRAAVKKAGGDYVQYVLLWKQRDEEHKAHAFYALHKGIETGRELALAAKEMVLGAEEREDNL